MPTDREQQEERRWGPFTIYEEGGELRVGDPRRRTDSFPGPAELFWPESELTVNGHRVRHWYEAACYWQTQTELERDRRELAEAALQAEREKTEAARRQRDAAERELAAAHKKSAAPGGEVCQRITPEQRSASRLPAEQPDMADISGRSEAKDKPPITAHTEQPDTEGGDADEEAPQTRDRREVCARLTHVAEGAAVDDGRALDQQPGRLARLVEKASREVRSWPSYPASGPQEREPQRLARALRAYAAQEDTYADQAGNAVESATGRPVIGSAPRTFAGPQTWSPPLPSPTY